MGSSPSTPKQERLIAIPGLEGTTNTLYNGLLYRIFNEETCTMAFFNNSKDYEFHVSYLFNGDSTLVSLGKTTMIMQDDGVLCEVVVYPAETQFFVQGTITGFENKITACPLSEEYLATHPNSKQSKYSRRLAPPKASSF